VQDIEGGYIAKKPGDVINTTDFDAQVTWQGEGYQEPRNFEATIRKWRKMQTTTMLAVECPNDKLDAVKAAITKAGGKIIT
jgi:hypothetical protein